MAHWRQTGPRWARDSCAGGGKEKERACSGDRWLPGSNEQKEQAGRAARCHSKCFCHHTLPLLDTCCCHLPPCHWRSQLFQHAESAMGPAPEPAGFPRSLSSAAANQPSVKNRTEAAVLRGQGGGAGKETVPRPGGEHELGALEGPLVFSAVGVTGEARRGGHQLTEALHPGGANEFGEGHVQICFQVVNELKGGQAGCSELSRSVKDSR